MTNSTCLNCDKPLTGKQQTMCSDLCHTRHWRASPAGQASRQREAVERTCELCGKAWMTPRKTAKFCSYLCRDLVRSENAPPQPRRTERPIPKDQRGPIRRACEDGDWPAMRAHLAAEAVRVGTCWLWPARVKGGYGVVRIGKREHGVHRLMMAAVRGGLVESHLPVHHKCAERLCFNPDHLQVVEPHENVAEMLERNYYLQRIAELEAALIAVAPHHAALTPRAA